MNDKVIKIEVDGREFEARPGQMLIEVTDDNDIYVPRFCYHKKLSVAANCRMCLVEVEKAPKPLPACATPVMDGMKVMTRSKLALEAQKSVMEFLLINHPLDCPICDQGGECELQDLAMGYGRDVSRYQENKRVVKDKNIGPLVQTDMTRCIHCTRCVRFGEEVAGLRELGATGRSEHMEIGTYVEKSMVSEMSGNVIDLCPVGALTSKPFRYSARTWEMRQSPGIAQHDCVGSNIHFHTMGNIVKRVVPAENEAVNEVWISDRDRFSYEGMYSEDRLTTPMIKRNGAWQETDWMSAFEFITGALRAVIDEHGPQSIAALASANATTEELYLLQKFMRAAGSGNIDHRLQQADFSDQDAAPVFPWLGCNIADLEQMDVVLVVGGNPRKDQPIINHRLRKAALRGADIILLNPVAFETNFDLTSITVNPADMPRALAAVIKGLKGAGKTTDDNAIDSLVANADGSTELDAITQKLLNAGKVSVLLGNMAIGHAEFASLRTLAGTIARMCEASFGYLPDAANSAGAWITGAVPHRGPATESGGPTGLTTQAMFEQKLPAYLLLGVEPELDCWDGSLALAALREAGLVISMTAFRSPAMDDYADVLLPVALYAENEGTTVNAEGRLQTFKQVIHAPGEARPAWKVLRVLGNSLELPGFDYSSIQDLTTVVNELVTRVSPANTGAWNKVSRLNSANGAYIRVTERPTNSTDPLVRRALALQQTADVADGTLHISNETASEMGLAAGASVRVQQNGMSMDLPVTIDKRLSGKTVLMQAGKLAYGPGYGEIEITKV